MKILEAIFQTKAQEQEERLKKESEHPLKCSEAEHPLQYIICTHKALKDQYQQAFIQLNKHLKKIYITDPAIRTSIIIGIKNWRQEAIKHPQSESYTIPERIKTAYTSQTEIR